MTAALTADELNLRVLTTEALDREAFQIHGSSGLGTSYLLGALQALVPGEVWWASVAAAQAALAADRERAEAAKS